MAKHKQGDCFLSVKVKLYIMHLQTYGKLLFAACGLHLVTMFHVACCSHIPTCEKVLYFYMLWEITSLSWGRASVSLVLEFCSSQLSTAP